MSDTPSQKAPISEPSVAEAVPDAPQNNEIVADRSCLEIESAPVRDDAPPQLDAASAEPETKNESSEHKVRLAVALPPLRVNEPILC